MTETPAPAWKANRRATSLSEESRCRSRASTVISDSPVPNVSGAVSLAKRPRSDTGTSTGGHTCRKIALFCNGFRPLCPACARRIDSRQAASTRSATGNDTTAPSASRTGVTSRTSASATNRSSDGLFGATRWNT